MQMIMLEIEMIKKMMISQAIQKQVYSELEEANNKRPVMTSSNVHMPGRLLGIGGGSSMESPRVWMAKVVESIIYSVIIN